MFLHRHSSGSRGGCHHAGLATDTHLLPAMTTTIPSKTRLFRQTPGFLRCPDSEQYYYSLYKTYKLNYSFHHKVHSED